MSHTLTSNWRAVSCLMVPLILACGWVVPAWGTAYLTDENTGVAEQMFGADRAFGSIEGSSE